MESNTLSWYLQPLKSQSNDVQVDTISNQNHFQNMMLSHWNTSCSVMFRGRCLHTFLQILTRLSLGYLSKYRLILEYNVNQKRETMQLDIADTTVILLLWNRADRGKQTLPLILAITVRYWSSTEVVTLRQSATGLPKIV